MTDAKVQLVTVPPHLDHEALALAQRETLNTPRRPYGPPARALFRLLDVLYGRKRTLMYVVRPAWSYELNADFEDHAEHEYMTLVTEHPEWENQPFISAFEADYGSFESLADLFRQIGHDERVHKQESLDAPGPFPLSPFPVNGAARRFPGGASGRMPGADGGRLGHVGGGDA